MREAITITIPVSFLRKETLLPTWPTPLESLLNNLVISMRSEILDEIAKGNGAPS